MTTTQTAQTETLSVKETAAALRRELKAQFPGVKFYVRMSTGTGYGWLSVGWDMGPSYDAVKTVGDGFQSSRFDGMDDGYHRTGVTRFSCCGINYSGPRA